MNRPNIIFIVTDSQSANMVKCYSGQELETNHLDKLAEEGIRFDRAYCPAPICTPCRAAMFTGIYSHTSGPWTNSLAVGTNIPTMGKRFQDLGYETPYIGKWHLDGHDYFGSGNCPEGWDERYWFEGKNYLDELTPREVDLWRRGLSTIEDLERENIDASFTWAHRIGNRAIDFLTKGRDKSKPFLMVLSYDEPHHPWTCPPEYAQAFKDFEYDLGPSGGDMLEGKPSIQQEWAEALDHPAKDGKVKSPLIFGCNSFVDDEIGRVVEVLDREVEEDTWLVYVSDHGEMMGAHNLSLKGCAGYEEITRIPFIVRPPKNSDALRGTTENTLVSLVDILPTFLELAGETPPPSLHGDSIKALFTGKETNLERAVFTEFNRYELAHDSFGGFKPMRMIVQGHYKMVLHLLSTDELYDLNEDPGELNNLINDPEYTEVRNKLHQKLLDWMDDKRDPFRCPEWERRPWQNDQKRDWMGLYRPSPDDGYSPKFRDYDTGLPNRGVKREEKTTPSAL